MDFDFIDSQTSNKKKVDIAHLVIAGWAGRDKEALEHHITELERAGIPRPEKTPEFFHVGTSLLTQHSEIQVSSTSSSGEVEVIILSTDEGLWVGLGSDHTDRKLEATSIPFSKQVCPKPIAKTLWNFNDIKAHWDQIELRSYRFDNGERSLYQEGTLSVNRSPFELLELYEKEFNQFEIDSAMFCGTLPAKSEISFSDRFEMEIFDPILDRRMSHAYSIVPLPD